MARRDKPLPSLDWLQPRVKLSRALSLFSFAALVVLLVIWSLVADLHGARAWVITSVQLLPLAILAPGLIAASPRAHAWTCFVVNLYFIQGVQAAFDPANAVFGFLESIISASLFCTALLYTRWRFQYERATSANAR